VLIYLFYSSMFVYPLNSYSRCCKHNMIVIKGWVKWRKMKGRRYRILQCLGVLWLSVIFLYVVLLPVQPIATTNSGLPPVKLDPPMTCLIIKSKRVCVEASPSPKHSSEPLWASFIGIGPILSGGTSVLQMLKLHPQVQIGDRWQNSKSILPDNEQADCCKGAELYFFGDERKLSLGLRYYKGFFLPRKPGAKIAGESSPNYSDHPLLPYRVRAMLGPDVKLLFTIRDPVDALLSLYLLRNQDERIPAPVYFHKLLKDQKAYDDCLETKITSLFRGSGRTSSTLYYEILSSIDLDIHNKMLLDETAMLCWNQKTSIQYQLERLQQYLYKENLMRWNAVLPNQILCIWSDEFVATGLETINSVFEFLGVDLIPQMPPDFSPFGNEVAQEEKKRNFKKDLGSLYKEMCDYLSERNRGLEKLCPRRNPGNWGWCADS